VESVWDMGPGPHAGEELKWAPVLRAPAASASVSRRRAETTAGSRRRSPARTRLRNLCALKPARRRRWPGRARLPTPVS